MSSHAKKEKNQHIQVFVRVRPVSKQEEKNNCVFVKNTKELSIKYHEVSRVYKFDRVFGPDSRQIDIYKMVAQPLVKEVINGYNCTILAYGQTGTGKTYTMAGGNPAESNPFSSTSVSWTEDIHSGIIPRTLSHMFDELRLQSAEFNVRISYLELYNEEIFDLLSASDEHIKIKLYDDSMKKGSVIVNNLTEKIVSSKADVFKILEKGAEKRKVASTLMNAQSSRSHTVFCIMVHLRENNIDGEDLLKTGKLYLVDLAGSENIKQSGATEIRAREACSINQSLLTLGRCISKLVERSAHIPYRESKLTRLLQDSLGGRTKTTLIATVSPSACNADESLNTLEYASRAKNITNKPEINQKLCKNTLIKEYTNEIDRLKRDLLATRQGSGVFVDADNYTSLMKDIDTFKEEINEKIIFIRVLKEEMAKKEELCDQLQMSVIQHQKIVEDKENTINTLESKLHEASEEITELRTEGDFKQFVVEKYAETEEQLKSTVQELLTVADTKVVESHKLHDKIDTITDITKQNKQTLEQQLKDLNKEMTGIDTLVRSFHDKAQGLYEDIKGLTNEMNDSSDVYVRTVEQYMQQLIPLKDMMHQIKLNMSEGADTLKTECEDGQVNCIQQFEVTRKNCYKLVVDHVIPALDEVLKVAVEQEYFYIQSVNQMNTFSDSLINLILKSSGSIKSISKAHKEKMTHEIEVLLGAYSMIEEKNVEQNDLINAFKDEITKKNEVINELLKSVSNMGDEYMQKRTEIANSCNEIMQAYKENLQALKKSCEEDAEDIIAHAKKLHEDGKERKAQLDDRQEKFTLQIAKTNHRSHSAKSDLDMEIETLQPRSDALLMELEKKVIKSISGIRDVCAEEYSKPLTNIMESETGISSLLEEMEIDNKAIQQGMPLLLYDLEEKMDDHKMHCDTLESNISTKIDSCHQDMRNILKQSFKEYKVTGETPQRKSQTYPRVLVETKPKEMLREEFQGLKETVETSEESETDKSGEKTIQVLGENIQGDVHKEVEKEKQTGKVDVHKEVEKEKQTGKVDDKENLSDHEKSRIPKITKTEKVDPKKLIKKKRKDDKKDKR